MKRLLGFSKTILRRIVPFNFYLYLQKAWNARNTRRSNQRCKEILEFLIATYGRRVLQGPFAGMKYIVSASGSELIPKLVGTYESELHATIERIISSRYDRLIDVGCAEGYYAVGIAYRCQRIFVEAYDIDPIARKRCEEMSRLNGVQDRLKIGEMFTPDAFQSDPDKRTLIICDCEGAELELFGLSQAHKWANCDILVELHDFLNPEITPSIIVNLSESHDIQLINSLTPDANRNPILWFLKKDEEKLIAVAEQRVPMQWALITRRQPN